MCWTRGLMSPSSWYSRMPICLQKAGPGHMPASGAHARPNLRLICPLCLLQEIERNRAMLKQHAADAERAYAEAVQRRKEARTLARKHARGRGTMTSQRQATTWHRGPREGSRGWFFDTFRRLVGGPLVVSLVGRNLPRRTRSVSRPTWTGSTKKSSKWRPSSRPPRLCAPLSLPSRFRFTPPSRPPRPSLLVSPLYSLIPLLGGTKGVDEGGGGRGGGRWHGLGR